MSQTVTEALDKFQKTVEMLSRNKVTRINAFENRLLDRDVNLLESAGKDASEEKWRYYSTVIDACGKVYGYCVDHIHEETFKILGGVARTYENEQNPETRSQVYQKRNPVHGTLTIEENESAMTLKELDRTEKFDSFFSSMKKTFDSSKCCMMLLNTISINSNLDLTYYPEDPIFPVESKPNNINFELEGLSELNEIDLFNLEICPYLEKCSNRVTSAANTILDIFENLDKPCAIPSYEDSIPSEPETSPKKKNDFPEVSFKVTLEERLTSDQKLDFIDSEALVFSKDYLEANVTKKAKKRKRKVPLKDLNYEQPKSVLKIEIDKEGENLITKEEKSKLSQGKTLKPFEIGYKESRLCELFTRKGHFTRLSSIPILDQADLMIPEFSNPEQADLNSDKNLDFDLRYLKENISRVLKDSKNDFYSLIDSLPSTLDSKTLDHLSFHSCFVTILHLANEQNLTFEKQNECNFLIKKSH